MRKLLKLDLIIVSIVRLLLLMGLSAIYSLSVNANEAGFNNFDKQLVAVVIGLASFFFFAFFDYRALSAVSTKLYFIALALLASVFLIGSRIRGATAWIGLGPFHLEPVEVVKLVMIIFLASFLSKKKTHFSIAGRAAVSVALVGIPLALILKQPDFGSASVVVGIWAGMLFASGINKKVFFALFMIAIAAASSGWFFLKDYQKERIINFIHPQNDPRGSGYNVTQATIAVGSGGIWGKGLGQGSQSQLNFLPEKHTDFIFAVFAEDLGFFGSAIILALFGILIYRIKKTAALARDNFGYLIAVGVIMMFFVQIAVNAGMNVGLVPVAGVPLPLLSYGGSSMVAILTGLGLVQSIYVRRIKAGTRN